MFAFQSLLTPVILFACVLAPVCKQEASKSDPFQRTKSPLSSDQSHTDQEEEKRFESDEDESNETGNYLEAELYFQFHFYFLDRFDSFVLQNNFLSSTCSRAPPGCNS